MKDLFQKQEKLKRSEIETSQVIDESAADHDSRARDQTAAEASSEEGKEKHENEQSEKGERERTTGEQIDTNQGDSARDQEKSAIEMRRTLPARRLNDKASRLLVVSFCWKSMLDLVYLTQMPLSSEKNRLFINEWFSCHLNTLRVNHKFLIILCRGGFRIFSRCGLKKKD